MMMESPERSFRFDGFILDPLNLRLTANGEIRALEPKSFRLLQFLIENRHRAVRKEEILTTVWEGVAVSDNALTRAVAQIRKALDDDPKQPLYVETIPTVGYRFMGMVSVESVLASSSTPVVVPARPLKIKFDNRRWILLGACALPLLLAVAGLLYFRRSIAAGPAIRPVPLTSYQAAKRCRPSLRTAARLRSPGMVPAKTISTSI